MKEIEETTQQLLAQGETSKAIAFLRQRLGWSREQATRYLFTQVRAWGAAHDALLRERQIPPATFLEGLAHGSLSSQDWIQVMSQGLYLEQRKIFLPWHAPLPSLEMLGTPEALNDGDYLFWPEEAIFGGLQASIMTGSLLSFHGLVQLSCRPKDDAIYGNPWAGIQSELEFLTQLFGLPAEKQRWGGYRWSIGNVEIALTFRDCNEMHFSEDFHKEIELRKRVDFE